MRTPLGIAKHLRIYDEDGDGWIEDAPDHREEHHKPEKESHTKTELEPALIPVRRLSHNEWLAEQLQWELDRDRRRE